MAPPHLIFGCANVGPHYATVEDVKNIASVLQEAGISHLDTAARYGGGASEKLIGEAELAKHFTIDTKVLFTGPDDVTLSAEWIEKSLTNSLQKLGVEKVNVLYCHAMDKNTPVEETARAMDEQYRKGRFNYLGVSNFSTPLLQQWLELSDENNWVKPTYYQGQYNLLCRSFETTLFPLLKQHKIYFNAYSPVAGGFLLGNFTPSGTTGSRFAGDSLGAKMSKAWYDHGSMHEAVRRERDICEKAGLDLDEAVLRWLVWHSALGDGDGVILGASRAEQVRSAAEKIKKGPLEGWVADDLSALWEGVKDEGLKIVEF